MKILIFCDIFIIVVIITVFTSIAIIRWNVKRTKCKQQLYINVTVKDIMQKIEHEKEINEHKIVMKRLIKEPYVITFVIDKKDIKKYERNSYSLRSHDIVHNITKKIISEGFPAEYDFFGVDFKIFVAI